MFRLRSSLTCLWLFALFLVAASAARAQDPSWQLIAAPVDDSTTAASENPPPPNPTHHVYVIHSNTGVYESPLPDTIKEDLQPLEASQGPGPIPISLEGESGESAYLVSQEIAEGIDASEKAGELTPEIAAIAEPLDDDVSASGTASPVGVNSIFGGSCATQDKSTTRSFPLNGHDWNKTFDLGGGVTGTLTFTAQLQGTVTAELNFGIKRKNVLGFCVPYGVKFKNLHLYGNATSNSGLTLQGTVAYQSSFGPWQITKPQLFSYTFTIGYVPVTVGVNLPVNAGFDVTASAVGVVNYNGTHVATGSFDYNCTLDDCTGSSTFDNTSPTGSTQEVTAGVSGRVKPTAYVDVALRAFIYSDSIIYGQVGLRPYLLGDLWGYAGNGCGDADGDGNNENVHALTFDLDRRVDVTGEFHILGHTPWKKTLRTGTVTHFRFWDLLNSDAMQPQLHGPALLNPDVAGAYKVKIRPCWPYTDQVTYQLNWGDGGALQQLQGAPGTEVDASHTWTASGNKTVTATSASDAHGRTLDQGYSRTVEVKPWDPIVLTVTPSPGSVTQGGAVTWTATATGGDPATLKYALFRRRAGTTPWLPDVTAPAWQTGNVFSWTTSAADLGVWEIVVWAKDSHTPANQNTYGYAAYANAGPTAVVSSLALSCPAPASPAVTYGNAVNWTVSSTGGTTGTIQYTLSRNLVGTSSYAPLVWQTGTALTWTPAAADLGTWQVSALVKDVNTPASPGYTASCNLGQVKVVAPLAVSVTPSPSTSVQGNAIAWTATATGGTPATTQYAFFRRLAGTTPWTPDVTQAAWQSSNSFSWTPGSADIGTWEIVIWVKDGNTPASMNTYGYAAYVNAGPVNVVRPPLALSVTPSPSSSVYGNAITWTATATGGNPATTKYAFFGRLSGATAWTPDVAAPTWQTSNTMTWTPTSANAGTWEIVVWVKDGDTPASMNTYGYAAYANAGPVQIVAPVTVSGTGSPAYSPYGTTLTWTATASGGVPATTKYAFFRRRAGTTPWTPDVTVPSWQTGNVMSWTPSSADTGTWEIIIWVKDGTTPASMNTYGYAGYYNAGPVQVVAPLSLGCSASPSPSYTGQNVTLIANAGGGVPASTQYAFFRRLAGTTAWTPAVTSPSWQTSNVFTWTPSSSETGTWETYVWVKDGTTPVNQNTYGYGAGCNSGLVQIVTSPSLSVTGSPSSAPYGQTLTWTASSSGGTGTNVRYAFFRRLAGSSTWTPDVNSPAWQTSNTYSWTPTSSDTGTWETYVWMQDSATPFNMNTYGYAAGYNSGPVQIVTPAPLTVSGTGSPSSSPAGTTLTWTATASGGVASTVQYALFRRLAGTSNWIPDVTAPAWQSSNTLTWTPSASNVGTWEIIIWVKDVNTSPTQNTYGFSAYYNAMPVQVY